VDVNGGGEKAGGQQRASGADATVYYSAGNLFLLPHSPLRLTCGGADLVDLLQGVEALVLAVLHVLEPALAVLALGEDTTDDLALVGSEGGRGCAVVDDTAGISGGDGCGGPGGDRGVADRRRVLDSVLLQVPRDTLDALLGAVAHGEALEEAQGHAGSRVGASRGRERNIDIRGRCRARHAATELAERLTPVAVSVPVITLALDELRGRGVAGRGCGPGAV